MTTREPKGIDPELARWNDDMYRAHATPYGRGLVGTIQRARVGRVLAMAGVGPGDSVVEIGCEAGHLLEQVPACRRLVGVDVSRAALDDAATRLSATGREVEFYQADAERPLPFQRGEFDVVLCSEMIEHVGDPDAVVRSLAALADRETRVVLSVPIEAPKVAIKNLLDKLGLLERLFPGIERGQSEWHIHAFTPKRLLEITAPTFRLVGRRIVWGAHYVAAFRLATDPAPAP